MGAQSCRKLLHKAGTYIQVPTKCNFKRVELVLDASQAPHRPGTKSQSIISKDGRPFAWQAGS